MTNKLCAQQTAKIRRKAPEGIFDGLRHTDFVRLFFLGIMQLHPAKLMQG